LAATKQCASAPRRIERGKAKSITDLAEQESVTDAYVCRLLPLACVAPDVVEAILDGRQSKGSGLIEVLVQRRPEERAEGEAGLPLVGESNQSRDPKKQERPAAQGAPRRREAGRRLAGSTRSAATATPHGDIRGASPGAGV
jgi:hypothetical protein